MEEDGEFSHDSEAALRRLYPVLRAMAGERMVFERAGHTLQPTALAHEAWLRMRSGRDPNWKNSSHFCAAAAETMRRILIDRARRRKRLKHAGTMERVSMSTAEEEETEHDDEPVLLVNAALEKLKKANPLRAKVVLLKFFGGMTNQEVAEELGVTERTVERYWAYSKTWLFREIQGER